MAADELLGTTLGRYRVEEILGEGGMGRVYLGVDAEHAQRVAIKVLQEQTAEQVERFAAEARAVSLISHFNIVNLMDLGTLPDGRPYMVMELVEGRSLRDAAPGTSLPELMRLCGEVLAALAAVHAIGIVHRDLKPDNIMVTRLGHAKVLDFGVAKLAPGVGGGLTPRTTAGLTVGTPAYMAPEQVVGAAIDGRADLYTMGIVMYEALTGHRPFDGTDLELMRAHRDKPPPSPRTFRPSLPVAIERVVMRALEKHPGARYPDAKAMATAIEAAVRGEVEPSPSNADTPHAGVPTVRAKLLAPRGSNRSPAILGVVAVGVAAAIAFGVARSRRSPTQGVAPPGDAQVARGEEGGREPRLSVAGGLDVTPVDAAGGDAAAVDAAAVDAAGVDAAGGDAAAVDAAAVDVAAVDVAPGEASPRIMRAPNKIASPSAITVALDGDPRAFAPVAFFASATQIARRIIADAQPIFMYAERVEDTQLVDLAAHPVTYRFISPSHTAPGSACLVVVEASGARVTAKPGTDKQCATRSAGPPRCSLARVLAKLAAMRSPELMRENYETISVYWKNGRWTVRLTRLDANFPIDVPDDC